MCHRQRSKTGLTFNPILNVIVTVFACYIINQHSCIGFSVIHWSLLRVKYGKVPSICIPFFRKKKQHLFTYFYYLLKISSDNKRCLIWHALDPLYGQVAQSTLDKTGFFYKGGHRFEPWWKAHFLYSWEYQEL